MIIAVRALADACRVGLTDLSPSSTCGTKKKSPTSWPAPLIDLNSGVCTNLFFAAATSTRLRMRLNSSGLDRMPCVRLQLVEERAREHRVAAAAFVEHRLIAAR